MWTGILSFALKSTDYWAQIGNVIKKEQNLPHFLCAGRVTECSKNFPFLLVSIRNFSNRVLVDKDKFIDPYELVTIK